MKKYIFFIVLFGVIIIGCGYKPTANRFNNNTSKTVFIDIKINYDNANNSVYLKELLLDFAINKLKLKITTNKSEADNFLTGSLSTKISQLQTNSAGYGVAYRAKVKLSIKFNKKKYNLNAYYDYDISDNAVDANYQKEKAIKIAISRAFNELYSNILLNPNS